MGILVSFTNKTERHDITEILLKMALNTKILNQSEPNLVESLFYVFFCCHWLDVNYTIWLTEILYIFLLEKCGGNVTFVYI
jgi:hypothetical protein